MLSATLLSLPADLNGSNELKKSSKWSGFCETLLVLKRQEPERLVD
jgi:hypothetical protein